MGEANRRGTYEQRKAEAIERNKRQAKVDAEVLAIKRLGRRRRMQRQDYKRSRTWLIMTEALSTWYDNSTNND